MKNINFDVMDVHHIEALEETRKKFGVSAAGLCHLLLDTYANSEKFRDFFWNERAKHVVGKYRKKEE